MDESKLTEWTTLIEKKAIRVHVGKHAAWLKQQYPDRFVGSRFVIVRKLFEKNLHLDINDVPGQKPLVSSRSLGPRFRPETWGEGLLQSPTLSQIGRMILMQLISSFQWDLQLGDIKGAFLEAGPLPERFRPLYARMPAGGIPTVPDDAVLEVVGKTCTDRTTLHRHGTVRSILPHVSSVGNVPCSMPAFISLEMKTGNYVVPWEYMLTTQHWEGKGKDLSKQFINSNKDFPIENGVCKMVSFVEPSMFRTLRQKESPCLNKRLPKTFVLHTSPKELTTNSCFKIHKFGF